MDESEAKSHLPRVVHVDGGNRIVELGEDPAAPSPGVLGQVRGDTVPAPHSR
jgi:aspartate 1-decarboxylase